MLREEGAGKKGAMARPRITPRRVRTTAEAKRPWVRCSLRCRPLRRAGSPSRNVRRTRAWMASRAAWRTSRVNRRRSCACTRRRARSSQRPLLCNPRRRRGTGRAKGRAGIGRGRRLRGGAGAACASCVPTLPSPRLGREPGAVLVRTRAESRALRGHRLPKADARRPRQAQAAEGEGVAGGQAQRLSQGFRQSERGERRGWTCGMRNLAFN